MTVRIIRSNCAAHRPVWPLFTPPSFLLTCNFLFDEDSKPSTNTLHFWRSCLSRPISISPPSPPVLPSLSPSCLCRDFCVKIWEPGIYILILQNLMQNRVPTAFCRLIFVLRGMYEYILASAGWGRGKNIHNHFFERPVFCLYVLLFHFLHLSFCASWVSLNYKCLLLTKIRWWLVKVINESLRFYGKNKLTSW